jgi:hypothetical protein
MGYLLKDHIKPIMQCLSNDLQDWYMRLLTTKCLNNAVTLTYLMLGPRGMRLADACDSHKVQERHKAKEESNPEIIEALKKKMLHKVCKYRQLYYILMTDAEFNHPDGVKRHFPGHVFVIEKIPNKPFPKYYFHQSYINQYDYKGHIQRNNNSLAMTYAQIEAMLAHIHYVLMSPTWDENSVKYWKTITFVDTSKLLGAESGGKMFLCFRKARTTDCVGTLDKYITKKLIGISKHKLSQLDDIYGDKTKYDSDQNPLTVREMQKSLQDLQRKIRVNAQ